MSGAKVPESSSAQFDALIELLATEDTGENSNFHIVPEGTASTGLRDGDGKLDYAKIRSLFLQRQGSDDVNRVPFFDPASHHEPSSGIKLPQVSYESYGYRRGVTLTFSDCGGRTDGRDRSPCYPHGPASTKSCRVRHTRNDSNSLLIRFNALRPWCLTKNFRF
jgi:hypothetical protein